MYYDAIILDGKFFKSKEEQKGTEIDNTAFGGDSNKSKWN